MRGYRQAASRPFFAHGGLPKPECGIRQIPISNGMQDDWSMVGMRNIPGA